MLQNKTDLKGWSFESGLAEEYDFSINRAYFGYLDEYNNGEQLLLIWEGSSPDADVERVIWPCGKGWRAADGGMKAEHDSRKRFVKTTLIARMMTRVVGELGLNLPSHGEMTESKIWGSNGEISFHMKLERIEYGPGILEDKGGVVEHVMPVTLLKTQSKPTPNIPVSLLQTLTAMAKSNDETNFVKKAISLAEVKASPEFTNYVIDSGNYNRLRNS